MTTTITTADPLPIGSMVIIGREWVTVTGEVGPLTYTVAPVDRGRRWRIRAHSAVNRWRYAVARRLWWPIADPIVEAWEKRHSQ